MDEWAILLHFAGRRRLVKERFSFCVHGKLKIPSLTVSEGKKRNGKPVPYVTGRISEAWSSLSVCASVPFVQLHARKNTCKWLLLKSNSGPDLVNICPLIKRSGVWLPDLSDQQWKIISFVIISNTSMSTYRQHTSYKVKWWSSILTLLLLSQMPGTVSFVSQPEAPHLSFFVSLTLLYIPLNLGWHQTALT